MSRSVVPAIVLVTLTIMFGSSLLAQRHAADRTGARESRQLAPRGAPSDSDSSRSGHGKDDGSPEAHVARADRVPQAAPPR